MNKAIRNLGLVGLVLGATAFSGCSNQFIKGKEFPPPRLTNGPYKGMKYSILNKKIAEETRKDEFIEIWDSNSFLRVDYNSDDSVKSIAGNLKYYEEAVRKIRENDTAFKSNFYIKNKSK